MSGQGSTDPAAVDPSGRRELCGRAEKAADRRHRFICAPQSLPQERCFARSYAEKAENVFFQKKVLTTRSLFAIISLVHDEHAPIAQLDRAFDYESKGHRFESCWVHHEPLTSFAPLAVFLFSLCCWKISRFAACAGWVAGRDFCYMFIASFSGHQTNYHKSYHNNICTALDFS